MIDTWMEQCMDWGYLWGSLLVLATWRALPIALIVMGIGWVFRNRIPPRLYAWLWLIVMVRFLMPLSIETPVSMQGSIDSFWGNMIYSDQPVHEFYAYAEPTHEVSSEWNAYLQTPDEQEAPDSHREVMLGLLFVSLTMLCSMLLFLRAFIAHLRFARRMRESPQVNDPRVLQMLHAESRDLRLGRIPPMHEIKELGSPAVFGWFRPAICFPHAFTSQFSEQELRWVLRHELAHIKRFDTLTMAIASIVRSLHWFNPLVWWSGSRLRAAVESAADDLALDQANSVDVVGYGNLLLRMAERDLNVHTPPVLGLIPFGSGKQLKQRIERIAPTRSICRRYRWAAFLLVPLLILVGLTDGLTDAGEETKAKKPVVQLLEPSESHLVEAIRNSAEFEVDTGLKSIRTYAIQSILDSLPESLKSSDLNAKERLIRWCPLLSLWKEQFHIADQSLIANLTPQQHEQLARTLEDWKEGEPEQINIEARFIHASVTLASSIDWIAKRVPDVQVSGNGPVIVARLLEPEFAKLMRDVSSTREGNILFAPKVTLFNGQKALVASEVKRPFVTDIDLQSGKAEPRVTVIDEGERFSVIALKDKTGLLKLDLQVRTSRIERVACANLPVRVPDQALSHVTVQVPEVLKSEVSLSVQLSHGETLIIGIPEKFHPASDTASDMTRLIAITPRLLK